MFFIIFFFLLALYPYLIYKYCYIPLAGSHTSATNNLNETNTLSGTIRQNKEYTIFINPIITNSQSNTELNPFYKNVQFDMFLTFQIENDNYSSFITEYNIIYPEEYLLLDEPKIYTDELTNTELMEYKLFVHEKNNNYIKNIIKYIKLVYPTYSTITFIFYDKYPFISYWLRQNIDEFNDDTTRYYNMLNLKSMLLKKNEDEQHSENLIIENQLHNTNENLLPLTYYEFKNDNKYFDFSDLIEELI
jgi:hypothetical protein